MIKKNFLLFFILFLFYCIPAYARTFTIPNWVVNSCVFIMKGEEAVGTGFLIGIREYGSTFCYLVTAKHVAAPVLSNNKEPLKVRFNLKKGDKAKIVSFSTFQFKGKRWIAHENPAIDMAVIPLSIFDKMSELEVGVRVIESPYDDFLVTRTWLDKYRIAPGDQAFTLGLIPYLYVKDQRNLVLSRFGKVSLLPKNEISLPGGKQRAYFLDCQAFPGNSGGPAFIVVERSRKRSFFSAQKFGLLGIVVEFVPSMLRVDRVDVQDIQQKSAMQLIENTGISRVIPVDYLVDILFSNTQKKFRKKIFEQNRKRENKVIGE